MSVVDEYGRMTPDFEQFIIDLSPQIITIRDLTTKWLDEHKATGGERALAAAWVSDDLKWFLENAVTEWAIENRKQIKEAQS